jgi:hypothetical protein
MPHYSPDGNADERDERQPENPVGGNAAATQSTTNNAINVVQNATRLEGVGR